MRVRIVNPYTGRNLIFVIGATSGTLLPVRIIPLTPAKWFMHQKVTTTIKS